MSDLRVTISYNDSTEAILIKAALLWPEFAGNRSALFRKIAADWDNIRKDGGGGRTARLEQRISMLENELSEIKKVLYRLLNSLEPGR